MRRSSEKVLAVFAEVEKIAEEMLPLRAEELRLRELMDEVWRTRTRVMATQAVQAECASVAEVAECAAGRSS